MSGSIEVVGACEGLIAVLVLAKPPLDSIDRPLGVVLGETQFRCCHKSLRGAPTQLLICA